MFLDLQPALFVPSPALITPLPDKFFVNKLSSKVLKSIDRKPPFCSLTSFFTVSVIQSTNKPLSSNDFTIFKRSCISPLEIISVV